MSNQIAAEFNLPLNRNVLLRNLLRELSGTLEDVVGTDEASGYISIVSQSLAE
jgi:hypothetical protein